MVVFRLQHRPLLSAAQFRKKLHYIKEQRVVSSQYLVETKTY